MIIRIKLRFLRAEGVVSRFTSSPSFSSQGRELIEISS